MNDIHLLVADKESAVRNAIKKVVLDEEYTCDEAADGITALKLFRHNDYHLVIVEIELPVIDGKNVCRQIRKISDIPIIALSESCSESDKLAAFEMGIDDYLCKPFSPQELLARIKVFLYRSGQLGKLSPTKITFNGLFIDTNSHAVSIDDSEVQLTPKEYDLLYFLSQNPGKAFSREMLLNEIWGYEFSGSDRTVDTHIKTLREAIKPYEGHIATVWGFGYKFVF
jgi:DNA-binding response OmpR family regulator